MWMAGAGGWLATTETESDTKLVWLLSAVTVLVVVPSSAFREYVHVQPAPGARLVGAAAHWPLGMPWLSITLMPVRVALPVLATLMVYQAGSPAVRLIEDAPEPEDDAETVFETDNASRGVTVVETRHAPFELPTAQ